MEEWDKVPVPVDTSRRIIVTYTNYKGITAVRDLTPIRFWFGSNQWHPEPQWMMKAFDEEKRQIRDFAMKDILSWMPYSESTGKAD